uniref:Uncharacterized protein n=1 Tax=Accipiter nisus TaxID=211598 RepID=A0A8B9S283_9AVES
NSMWTFSNVLSSHILPIHRRFENAPDTAKTKALQTVIEMKVNDSI